MYDYGLIGNCQVSALVSTKGSLDWLCLPRPDSDPVFGKILDTEGGSFSIDLQNLDLESTRQYYVENTNILVTELSDHDGNRVKITDFCPRFEHYGRMHRPMSVFRIVEPIRGSPFIKVSCNPVAGWSKEKLRPTRGNSHIQFEIRGEQLRLTTNMSLTYLCEEQFFQISNKIYFGLTWSTPIEEDLENVTERFLSQTESYWRVWVKHCSLPTEFQKETIRSALTLKLHCYEDTGAILAALTTSLPEKRGSNRNWDYRYCWLRDAYFVLTAFHNLGHFEEMEGFLTFFLDIAHGLENEGLKLAPVYSLSRSLPLPEMEMPKWTGHRNSQPVRINNQAAEHIQNDVYGEMILTLSPIFFDDRFIHLRNKSLETLLEKLSKKCTETLCQPDAGLWEIRSNWQEHTFTNLMCWAGLDRVSKIQERGWLKDIKLDVKTARERAFQAVMGGVKDSILRNSPQDSSLDASLALAGLLRFPEEQVCRKTVYEIQKKLVLKSDGANSGFYFRYLREDDFGIPDSGFLICSFWVVQALARMGEFEESKKVMKLALSSANHLGLLAEHFLPDGKRQLGNFPQAYSHVGLINAAFAVSPPWHQVL